MSNKRTITREIKVKQEKVLVGTFKMNGTYTPWGIRISYQPGGYTSHRKGERVIIPFTKNIPKFIKAGSFRDSVIHKVPSSHLTWRAVWQDCD